MSQKLPHTPHDALYHYYCEFDAIATIRRHQAPAIQPEEGVIRNFLGTRILPSVSPGILDARIGMVEGIPIPGNWHADIAEWAAALRTIEMARDTYRILELGCGWGCWITNMGVAARATGLKIELIGIDGDAGHIKQAHAILALNGFGEGDFRLVHGIASHQEGKAIFPVSVPGEANYGHSAEFFPDPDMLAEAEARKDRLILDCYTISQLVGDCSVDLLHVDIQGAESAYLIGSAEHIAKYVRRVLVGTHSRIIEGELMKHFLSTGWRLEMERPVIAPLHNGTPVTLIDGVQMWANPKFI